MLFEADRVPRVKCAKCTHELDVRDVKPFTTVKCPACGAPVQVPVKMGTMLLLKLLGHGSTGAVYKGRDTVLSRSVAVKIITKADGGDRERMLMTEARALAAVNHPNVLRIHNVGEHKGQSYIEMELLRGGNVREMIEAGDSLTELRCLQIARDAARALQAAQRVGLNHRDVKPENILLDEHGTAKLVDFGVARFRKQTAEKLVVGTPYYVAPEVVQQRGPIDFRADIYSLGCTLFHMLAGEPPFDSKTVTGVYMARLKQNAPYLCDVNPDIHPETAAVVDRMLQRNPDDRQEDYAQLVADLQWAIDTVEAGPPAPEPTDHEALTDALAAPAEPAPRRTAPRNSKSRGAKSTSMMPFVLVAVALIVLLGLIVFFILQLANGPPTPE